MASAVATSAAFLLKQRGAIAAPAVDGRHPLHSAADLFRSRCWTIGWLVLTHSAHGGVLAPVSPWPLAALLAMVVSFYAAARSLQLGPGPEVIALTSVARHVVAISGGILAFHDPIGTGPTQSSGVCSSSASWSWTPA